MEEKNINVPFYAYEAALERKDKLVKKLIIIIIALIISFFLTFSATTIFYIYQITKYNYSDDYILVDSENQGNANYIGNDGDINNGTSSSN